MNQSRYLKKFSIILAVFGICGMTAAFAVDSTQVKILPVKTAVQAYLLAHDQVRTDTGSYNVNQLATTKRCSSVTHPVLVTNISSINVYGAAQAIEGVNNSVTLNPANYMLTGAVSAPVNVEARDNGVTLNWQIWCEPNQTA